MSLDSRLHEALRRKAPPAGFTARVMDAIERESRPQRSAFSRGAWSAVAATFLVATIGGFTFHQQQKREGERAKEQLMLAMHLTSKKLKETQQHVHDVSTR